MATLEEKVKSKSTKDHLDLAFLAALKERDYLELKLSIAEAKLRTSRIEILERDRLEKAQSAADKANSIVRHYISGRGITACDLRVRQHTKEAASNIFKVNCPKCIDKMPFEYKKRLLMREMQTITRKNDD